MRAGRPKPFRVGMKASTSHVNIKHTQNSKSDKNQHTSMSELGKGRIRNMNPYQSVRKAETGLDSDIVPWESRECTLAEIRRSVVEAGSHEDLSSGSSQHDMFYLNSIEDNFLSNNFIGYNFIV